jgi:hypothetical protein
MDHYPNTGKRSERDRDGSASYNHSVPDESGTAYPLFRLYPVVALPDEDCSTNASGATSFRRLTDEQMISERDRLRSQLEELTMNPGRSPATSQVLVNMDRAVERMTDELRQRAIARHPSSGGLSMLRRFVDR